MHARRSLETLFLVAVALPVVHAESFNQDTSENFTYRREKVFMIPTIYGDLRRDFGDVASGYSLPAWTPTLSLDYIHSNLALRRTSPLVSRPSDPEFLSPTGELEQRDDMTLMWRQSYGWSWFGTEVIAKGSHTKIEHDGDEYHWGDLATRFLFSVARTRYSSWELVFGAQQPIGDKSDWEISHGFWTFEAGTRGTVGVGFFVIGLDLLAGYNPCGKNKIADELVHDDIEHRLTSGDGGLSVSYRPLTWMRIGAAQRAEYRYWKFTNNDFYKGSDHTLATPTSFVAEFTPWRSWHIAGDVGYDWAVRHAGYGKNDRLSFGANITTNF